MKGVNGPQVSSNIVSSKKMEGSLPRKNLGMGYSIGNIIQPWVKK